MRRLIDENRWRAKRFGTDAEFIAFDGTPPRACKDVVEGLLEMVAEDAQRLQCESALRPIRSILAEGTSAHVQLRLYRELRDKGESRTTALQAAVDWLIETTAGGKRSEEAPAAATETAD